LGGGTDFPYECIEEWINKKIIVDNFVILSDMMISEGFTDLEAHGKSSNKLIKQYKETTNKNLKMFSIDLEGYGMEANAGKEFEDTQYIKIFGMSDNVLKYISTVEGVSQI